jgi:DNA-binding CsgD family transcriptional regulator
MALLGAELNRARRLAECFEVLDRRLPEIVDFDHFNYLFADVAAGSLIRRTSPGLPAEIFDDYPACGAGRDLVLSTASRKQVPTSLVLDADGVVAPPCGNAVTASSSRLALGARSFAVWSLSYGALYLSLSQELAPGSCIHLAALADCPKKPSGWDQRVARLADAYGIIDSATLVLQSDRVRRKGLGLTVWRAKPKPRYTAGDLQNLVAAGPMLAAAFSRAVEDEYERQKFGAMAQILEGANQFTFFVSQTGALLASDAQVLSCLKTAFGDAAGPNGLPSAFSALLSALIRSLKRDAVHDGTASADFTENGHRCRVYLSDAGPTPDHTVAYKVLVNCNPAMFDLSLLAEAGLSEIQIKVVELLQGGAGNPEIARALGMSLGNVGYHLERIGEKLYASGRTEIVARAHALHHDLAIRRGLSARPGKKETGGSKTS